jgi:hypothetical protein
VTRADAIAALDVLAWLEMERQETQTRKGTLLGRYDRMTATDASRRKKRGLKRLRVQGPERERQGMKRAVFGLPVLPVKSPMHWL